MYIIVVAVVFFFFWFPYYVVILSLKFLPFPPVICAVVLLSLRSKVVLLLDPVEDGRLRPADPLDVRRHHAQRHVERLHAGTVAEALDQGFELEGRWEIVNDL